MRKIVGILQISIFILFGIILISFKFIDEYSYNETYWIAGVLYLILCSSLWNLGNRFRWFEKVNNDKYSGGAASKFTIPLVFVIGLTSLLRSKDQLLNIDSILPFVLLIIPLATLFGYMGYIAQSSMRPSQFKGSWYKMALVPILYLGSSFLAFSILISFAFSMPSIENESRTYQLANVDCNSKYLLVKTDKGDRLLFNPNQALLQQKKCESATKVEVKLQMNIIGIDYFHEFQYIK